MTKKIEYKDLANYFIGLSNETGNLISNLKLQKLMYYAQAWHLAYFKERLFDGDFEAWVHGPVLSDLYHNYKQYRWMPIVEKDLDDKAVKRVEIELLTEKQTELLTDVVNEYFGLTAFELERMTHDEAPWQKARVGLSIDQASTNLIKDEWMIEYYGKYITE